MAQVRVFLGFASASDHVLEETAGHLLLGLYDAASAMFPSPPVTKAAFQAALTAFTDAVAARTQGGTAATAARAVARDTLTGLMRQLALYVQTIILPMSPVDALAALLSSGFDAVSTSRAQHPLAKASMSDIENVGRGCLQLRLAPVANARNYEVQYKMDTGNWVSAGLFQSTRRLVVSGLTPGTNYTFQARAVGGSTGYGDWSDPVSHMSL